ncbi:MAG: RNA polymerase sigma factor [Polyangiaceae bacterium]|nr:RNA polymerase sigma factor [Polyangiaceae bacterium]
MSTFRSSPDVALPAAASAVASTSNEAAFALRAELAAFEAPARRAIACILHIPERSPDVDDCVQETLRRAVEHRTEAREPHALRGWVLGIARHVALDEIRARKRSRARNEPLDGEETRHDVPAAGPSPETQVAKRRELLQVSMALAGMPERQREALLLFHVEGVEYAEIGRRLGVPLGTVATWIARGRAHLVEKLSEDR